MNSDQLCYLIELSKNPSISAASLKLHITPQALSTAIKKLEDELGFTLLNRSFKGISLTADGEWLVQEAEMFLNKLESRKAFYQTKNTAAAHQGQLNIAFNYAGINNSVLSQLICQLYEEEPELKITLNEKSKDNILSDILSGNSEFGFIFRTMLNGSYTDILDPELTFESLFCGDMVLNVANSSELTKFNSITIKKAVQYPLCTYSPYTDSSNLLQNFFVDSLNHDVEIMVENNYSMYKEKISRGIANSLSIFFSTENLPNNYVEGTKIIRIRDDIKVFFGVVKKKDSILSENERFFLEELKTFVKELKKTE